MRICILCEESKVSQNIFKNLVDIKQNKNYIYLQR